MTDIGQRVIERLWQLSGIDAEWSVRRSRGFTWWAGELAQHVWADSPVKIDGHRLTRVHARTNLVKNGTSHRGRSGRMAFRRSKCED